MISTIYKSTYGSMSSDEWHAMINSALDRINSNRLGKMMINMINEYNTHADINISIVSEETYRTRVKIPKMTYYHGKSDIQIVIPAKEYRSKVRVIDPMIIPKCYVEGSTNDVLKYFAYICNNCNVPENIINSSDIKNETTIYKELSENITYMKEQPLEMIIAHEMVHCLRLLMDSHSETREEEGTIFGMPGNTIYLDGHKITENTIRREFGLPLRVNHGAEIISDFF